MSPDELTDSEIQFRLEVLKSRINRFFSDGVRQWTRADLEGDLKGNAQKTLTLRRDLIINAFQKWQSDGFVRVIGRNDCYLEILKKFPHDAIKRHNP